MPFLGSLDSFVVVWINWNGVSDNHEAYKRAEGMVAHEIPML